MKFKIDRMTVKNDKYEERKRERKKERKKELVLNWKTVHG